ncbi:MAG: DUF4924 family protein [Prolixibacteraceae bacterium]|nr:DUF4924 family protein [Prolixibacteraceae bacterium]
MQIAKQKRKENIAEYILYLYQIEDLIRAFRLDMDLISKQLIVRYQTDEKTLDEITSWYSNLTSMMVKEGLSKKGHLQFVVNQIGELNEFHQKLMQTNVEPAYSNIYQAVAGLITELKQKNKVAANDVQLSLDAIYGFLLLKMQNKKITPETLQAVKQLSNWLGNLSKLYKDFETGNLEV